MNNNCCLVFDKGSYMSKLGFALESEPRLLAPTIIAKPKSDNKVIKSNPSFTYGNKAKSLQGLFDITYPIQSKFSIDWNGLEELWSHFFSDDLMIPISDCNVLITEEDLNPKLNKKKISQIMFENFRVRGLYIINPSTLSLYSIGKDKGIVIDCGDLSTSFVPFKYGMINKNAMTRIELAGKEITNGLIKSLNNPIVNHRGIGDLMKEKTCFCSLDISNQESKVFSYELPDGNMVEIKDQQWQAPEILFPKQTIGNMNKGIQSYLCQTMIGISRDIEEENDYPLLLVGGTSLLKGFKERLHNEIRALLPIEVKYNYKMIEDADKILSSWLGGAIYCSVISSSSKWVTREMYQEKGANVICDSFN